MLCLQREFHGLRLIPAVFRPEPFEKLKSKIASQGVLNDLAVARAHARRANLDHAHDLCVERKGRPDFCHFGIIASMHRAFA